MMAASDKFEAVIHGRGGHGAMPHLTADPVVAGAQAVLALQPLISRELDPTDSGVVTVARFSTGRGVGSLLVVDGHPEAQAGRIICLTQAQSAAQVLVPGCVAPAWESCMSLAASSTCVSAEATVPHM